MKPSNKLQLMRRAWAMTASGLVLSAAVAHAQSTDAPISTQANKGHEVSEVVVNGVPYHETVLPTRLNLSSSLGLKLNVMDTPRNSTLISTTQLETLSLKDPRAFSYLTSSSYSDSSFGTPNIPRIRGQYADVYYNGMRYSFTENGYGVPINFDSFQNISITKGPASAIEGPGPGVGGSVDFLTKRPNLSKMTYGGDASLDTLGNKYLVVDVGGPIKPDELGVLISYSGASDDNTYFKGHYFYKNAAYIAVRWRPTDKYSLDFSGEVNSEKYTEDVGVNRVNQALINSGTYLTGGPTGEGPFAFGDQVGLAAGTGTPYAANSFGTQVTLGDPVHLSPRVTIDETPGVYSRGQLYNLQLIQSYAFNANLTLENNAFWAYQDSANEEPYYYADVSKGSWNFEDRTDLHGYADLSFGGLDVKNQYIAGVTFRFAHVYYISNFNTETVSVYDLTANPNLWRFPSIYQAGEGDNEEISTPFGAKIWGTSGRDIFNDGNGGISDTYDTGAFLQDSLTFTPQLSAVFGARIDAVQAHSHDPLTCNYGYGLCLTLPVTAQDPNPPALPADHTTGVYGLGDANFSVVYKPAPWVSTYATFDWVESENPNGGEGGINAYGQVPDSELLRSTSFLYEAGAKLNLFDNRLFLGVAGFDQKRNISTGPGGTQTDAANIRGVEIEANYQPNRNLFATASYSYIKTTLNNAPLFYDYPASPGVNYDGAGLSAVFKGGQTFDDPGVPQHLFNFLGNYKFDNGFGVRTGVQVVGPINTTASGWLNVAESQVDFPLPSSINVPAGATYAYYRSPQIPWQYTWNLAAFYEFGPYTLTGSIYNLTNQKNWQPSPNLYGNDFLVLADPISFEIKLQAKF